MDKIDEDHADPTPAEVGKFIPLSELEAWFKKMRKKYPQIFSKDDTLFGVYSDMHSMDQKLMTYFDHDPNQPMKCQVKGMRWVEERYKKHVKTPMYVVMFGEELSQITFTSAHEKGGWQRGWDVPPPQQNNA